MPEVFLIYPNNQAYLEGQAPTPASVNTLEAWFLPVPLFFLAIGLVISAIAASFLYETIVLTYDAIATTGSITRLAADEAGNYTVAFQYNVPDARLEAELALDQATYVTLSSERPIALIYARPDPSLVRLSGTVMWEGAIIVGAVALLWMGGALFQLISTLNRLRSVKRLHREGQVLEGQILHFERSSTQKARELWTIRFQFTTPEGQTITGERRYATRLGQRQAPTPGTGLVVFYVNTNHWELL